MHWGIFLTKMKPIKEISQVKVGADREELFHFLKYAA